MTSKEKIEKELLELKNLKCECKNKELCDKLLTNPIHFLCAEVYLYNKLIQAYDEIKKKDKLIKTAIKKIDIIQNKLNKLNEYNKE